MSTVVIAGAGPTGLMLACELGRAGVTVVLVDRNDERSKHSRAAAMHARTMEMLDQRGMLSAFMSVGVPVDAAHFAGIPIDMSTLPTRYPYMLGALDIHYGNIGDHPLIGRRVPDADVVTAQGRQRVFNLLHNQEPLLLELEPLIGGAPVLPAPISYVPARCPTRRWRLPVIGWVDVLSALLIRPDGYISWASSDRSDSGLTDALTVWRR
jgi:NAD(P)-dependent dehydrogenase (short-subunit alcohol dehydrogenase family)